MSKSKNTKGGKKKMEEREITMKQYVETCEVCGKEVSGTSPASASHNLRVHMMTHPSNKSNEKE